MFKKVYKVLVSVTAAIIFFLGFSSAFIPVQALAANPISSTLSQFYDFSQPFFIGCGTETGSGGSTGPNGIQFQDLHGSTQYTCGFKDFEFYLGRTLKLMIGAGILLSTLAIAFAGFKLIYSQGNPAELTKARKQLWYIIVGFFFMLTAFLIVKFILKGLGVDQSYYQVFIGS